MDREAFAQWLPGPTTTAVTTTTTVLPGTRGGGGRPKSPIFAVKGFAAGKVNGIPS